MYNAISNIYTFAFKDICLRSPTASWNTGALRKTQAIS